MKWYVVFTHKPDEDWEEAATREVDVFSLISLWNERPNTAHLVKAESPQEIAEGYRSRDLIVTIFELDTLSGVTQFEVKEHKTYTVELLNG